MGVPIFWGMGVVILGGGYGCKRLVVMAMYHCFSQQVEKLDAMTRRHSTPPPDLEPIPLSDIIGPLQSGGIETMDDNAFSLNISECVCTCVCGVCVRVWSVHACVCVRACVECACMCGVCMRVWSVRVWSVRACVECACVCVCACVCGVCVHTCVECACVCGVCMRVWSVRAYVWECVWSVRACVECACVCVWSVRACVECACVCGVCVHTCVECACVCGVCMRVCACVRVWSVRACVECACVCGVCMRVWSVRACVECVWSVRACVECACMRVWNVHDELIKYVVMSMVCNHVMSVSVSLVLLLRKYGKGW